MQLHFKPIFHLQFYKITKFKNKNQFIVLHELESYINIKFDLI